MAALCGPLRCHRRLISEQVKADYENGVLAITLPKKAEAKPKQIKVGIGGQAQGSGAKQVEGTATEPVK